MQAGFQLNKFHNLSYLTIPSFAATGSAIHAFSTRVGGISPAPFDSLNLAFHVGDDPGNVLTNRRRFCKALGIDSNSLVAGQQVHGDRVVTVNNVHIGKGAHSELDALAGVDALVTATPDLILSSYYADCVPLIFLDPVRRVTALAHAGWKGTVLRIGAKTVDHMREKHGCRAEDILAAVGPSIGPCCYEVDKIVISAVNACLPGHTGLMRPGRPGHWMLDLPEVNRRILLEAGIKSKNITMSGYCTACSNDLFYSYRRQKGRAGRMASFIMLTTGG